MKQLLDFLKEKQAFLVIKPGFLKYTNEIEKILRDNSWFIIKKETKYLSKEICKDLYNIHKDKEWFNDLVEYMSSDMTIGYLLQKTTDNPITDMNALKDKIRKRYSINDMKNVVHSSDSTENVRRENKIYFNTY